ncbi:transcriptional regulator, GntR family [Pseudonocardia thermophila]|jgi:Transcriptional regulators|uniref:Transcriptional regulator, GntR family n=1 Tax=Pseudonocardia thermophila TaxID=1848 RepID=A0A1M6P3K0_PSETH|nr:GntR family transcriptional regulator [Pseudonocardia thermophila]SHK02462.1 transcriptional regulator, GntR family [Pseudonocardia thermophila]
MTRRVPSKAERAAAVRREKEEHYRRSFHVEPVSRIADRVAEQVRDYIVENDLEIGARLPSERKLAELVGSSRPTVSQALRSLAVTGLIEIRPGSGAYVLRKPTTAVGTGVQMMIELEPDSIDEAVEMRHLLELAAADLITAKPQLQVTGIEEALQRLRAARGSASEWIAADTNFHVAYVRLAGNRYLTSVFESVHDIVVTKAYERWIVAGEAPPWLTGEEFGAQIALHEPIARALQDRDHAELVTALQRHQEALEEHMGVRR